MKRFFLASAAIAASASADVKSQYENDFVDSVLELKIKHNVDFFDELNAYLIELEKLQGNDSAIYKVSKAKLLYLRRQFPEAKALLESVKTKDPFYDKAIRTYVKYSTLLKDVDGQIKSLKIFFSDKNFYDKEEVGEDNSKYARAYLNLVSKGAHQNRAQVTLIKKIMAEKGWGTGPSLNDFPRYVEMVSEFEDSYFGESWISADKKKELNAQANKAELLEFSQNIDKLTWVNPKSPDYIVYASYASRIQAMFGKADQAITALNKAFPNIVEFEDALKKQSAQSGEKDWHLFTPVPATNYALAIAYYVKAQQLFNRNQKSQALGYLLGKKGGSATIKNGALQLLFFLVKDKAYRNNDIALEAPFKINKIVELINKINTGKKQIKLPPFDGDLFGEANFRQGNWKEAQAAYESFFAKAVDDNSLKRKAASLGRNYLKSITNQGKFASLEDALDKLSPFKVVKKPQHYYVDQVNFVANQFAKLANQSKDKAEQKAHVASRQRALAKLSGMKLDPEVALTVIYSKAQPIYGKVLSDAKQKQPLQSADLEQLEKLYGEVIEKGGNAKVATRSIFSLAYIYELYKKYDESLKLWDDYYNKVGNLTEVNKAEKLDALSRIAKIHYAKTGSSKAYTDAAKKFKDEYRKVASSLSSTKAKDKADKAKNRVDFIVIENTNAKMYAFKDQLRDLKKQLSGKSADEAKVVKVQIERLNSRIRKESAQSLVEYNKWLGANSGHTNYAYVLSKKADLLYVLGDKSSLVEAEKIEALLRKNFPDSPIVVQRATKFIDIKIQEKEWTEAIEASKKVISKGSVENQSDFVLDKLLRNFLFETKPNKKEVSATEFKGASLIANRCASILHQRFAVKKDKTSQARATQYMFMKGKSFVYLKQAKEAKNCFVSILSKNPKSAYLFDIKYLKAILEAQAGDFAKAHILLQEVIKLAQKVKPTRYSILFKAYATEVALYSASKNKTEIQAAFRMAELAKDIVVDNPKPSEQALIAKLQERVQYYWIINAAKLGFDFKEEQKRFIATYYSSPYLEAVRKASSLKSTFK